LISIKPVYRGLCPHCGGDIQVVSIKGTVICRNCSSEKYSTYQLYLEFMRNIESDFVAFFEKVTGFKPWGAQRHWVKRIIRGENAVLIAPTGVGKTTLLIAYAIYAASRGSKVLYITPTKSLMNQTLQRIELYITKTDLSLKEVLCYDSSKSKATREKVLARIQNCDYKLLVITNSFLLRNHQSITRCRPDIVIVDDVDSLLKNERSIYNLIKLLGFSDRAIDLAKRKNAVLWKLMVGKAMGKDVSGPVQEFLELDRELDREVSSSKVSQLIVASATGRTRGVASRILRDLLRVDLSGITIYGRSITDSYVTIRSINELVEIVLSIIKQLEGGCVIYISPKHPQRVLFEKAVERIIKELKGCGLKVAKATPRSTVEFINGKLDVLIGYSTYYGTSVRGLDAPKHIKYVIFLGVPVVAVTLDSLLARVNMLARALSEVGSRLNDSELRRLAVELRRRISKLSPSEKRVISLCLSGKIPEESISAIPSLSQLYGWVKDVYLKILEQVQHILDETRILDMGTITLYKSETGYYALIPDTMTYIQASGRASRLVGDKMTHGLSLVVEVAELINVVKGLEARLRGFNKSFKFRSLSEIDLVSEKEAIEKTRRGDFSEKLRYRSVLLVVESPTKAKTIGRFFGRPIVRKYRDLAVYAIPAKIGDEVVELNILATRGHIFDLTTQNDAGLYGILLNGLEVTPVYSTIKRCRVCGTQFVSEDRCPRCGSWAILDSKYVVEVLRKIASEVDEVYIATDPDLEGEKIAFDAYLAISPVNSNVWRLELHEISISELLRALENKRKINVNMVEAEMYRRMLDRLLGFSLSNRLQVVYGSKNLGAGRVQTPVLGMIIERYSKYKASKCKKLIFKFKECPGLYYSICLERMSSDVIEQLRLTGRVKLVKISEEVVEIQPKPPLTTDELLFEATKLGLSVEVAMKIAQDLFEAGLITYHRTDSTYISVNGIQIAREYLSKKRLSDLAKYSHWGDPGAHEAIRPTHPLDVDELVQAIDEGLIPVVIPLTGLHYKLYDLIFKRFIASQMKPYKAIMVKFLVLIGDLNLGTIELIVDIVEDGFNKVLEPRVYSSLRSVEEVEFEVSELLISESSRIPLYTSGDVVLLMKKLNIGRPSTYAKIIQTLKRHYYVVESKVRKKLVPTKRGIKVYEYLSKNYPDLVSIEVTRRMEEYIDKIERGELTGAKALSKVIRTLLSYKLLESSLIPLSYLNSYVGPTPPLDVFTPN
jgi:reverse gyrase